MPEQTFSIAPAEGRVTSNILLIDNSDTLKNVKLCGEHSSSNLRLVNAADLVTDGRGTKFSILINHLAEGMYQAYRYMKSDPELSKKPRRRAIQSLLQTAQQNCLYTAAIYCVSDKWNSELDLAFIKGISDYVKVFILHVGPLSPATHLLEVINNAITENEIVLLNTFAQGAYVLPSAKPEDLELLINNELNSQVLEHANVAHRFSQQYRLHHLAWRSRRKSEKALEFIRENAQTIKIIIGLLFVYLLNRQYIASLLFRLFGRKLLKH